MCVHPRLFSVDVFDHDECLLLYACMCVGLFMFDDCVSVFTCVCVCLCVFGVCSARVCLVALGLGID